MAILHLFPCGVMKGIFMMLSRSLRGYFEGTNTYEHVCNALDTSCDSKLHHHGNYYQENWVIKEWMEEGEDRITAIQQDRERKRKRGGGQRGWEEFVPKGQKPIDDTLHQLSSFDLRALPSRQSLWKPRRKWVRALKRLVMIILSLNITPPAIQYGMLAEYPSAKQQRFIWSL